jgi:hypothetical protein
VPADYDGDGRADVAVFRPSTGRWYILNRLAGTYVTRDWGLAGDIPVAADFDGDGKADVAVFRPALGRWFVTSSVDGSYQVVDWGLSGDVPLPDEYRRYGQTWLQHNPGWVLELWTDDNLPPDLERREVYDVLRQPAERSDMLIFEFLYRYGGVYIDTDFECLRPIGPLRTRLDIFCSYSHSDRLNNAIKARPAPPLIRRVCASCGRGRRTARSTRPTGPFFITELFVTPR